jgi:hypothetical protein
LHDTSTGRGDEFEPACPLGGCSLDCLIVHQVTAVIITMIPTPRIDIPIALIDSPFLRRLPVSAIYTKAALSLPVGD